MSEFTYQNGALHAEDVPLDAIAAEAGSPVYVYSLGAMRARLRGLMDAFSGLDALFCYAVKANSNLAVIKALAAEGAGADVVSAGELRRAIVAGVPPSQIVFAGVGKTRDEMVYALDVGIRQFNVESVPELIALGEIAAARRTIAPVALRINPNVAAGTHDKISTGRRHDKFGIGLDDAPDVYDLAARLAGIDPVGLHVHIGSQITDLGPIEAAYQRSVDLARDLRNAGYSITSLDLGGGFGVRYRDEQPLDPTVIANMVRRVASGFDGTLVFEPGRYLVAEAGVLLARVTYVKDMGSRRFLILDAGMNALVRPAMYGAHHDVLPVIEPRADSDLFAMDVVGPICESSDVFGRDRMLPQIAAGELVVLTMAGAYGSVMASDYNSQPRPAEVLVDGERWSVIKQRREPEAQFADEIMPDWLDPPDRQTDVA